VTARAQGDVGDVVVGHDSEEFVGVGGGGSWDGGLVDEVVSESLEHGGVVRRTEGKVIS